MDGKISQNNNNVEIDKYDMNLVNKLIKIMY